MVAAAPAGRFFAAPMASWLQSSLTVGVVVATILSFSAIYVLVRVVLRLVLKGLLAGKDPQNRSADRILGFCLAGLKTASAIWVGLSPPPSRRTTWCWGRKLGLTLKDLRWPIFAST